MLPTQIFNSSEIAFWFFAQKKNLVQLPRRLPRKVTLNRILTFYPLGGMRQFFVAVFLITALVSPSTVFAGNTLGTETASYFRVIWGLLVVLGIILVLYGIVKKRFSLLSASPSQNIKILEIKPMMGKKALCLVEVKGQEYLLGISGEQISHIATLSPPPKTSFAETLQATEVTPQS